jgi:hypothetical protein
VACRPWIPRRHDARSRSSHPAPSSGRRRPPNRSAHSSTPNGTLFEPREKRLHGLDQPAFKSRVPGRLVFAAADRGHNLIETSRGRRAPRCPGCP